MSADERQAGHDLAYRIIKVQCPHGRHNTTYCWSDARDNEAAIERDCQSDAAAIRPVIDAELATLRRQAERADRLAAALERAVSTLAMTKGNLAPGTAVAVLDNIYAAMREARAELTRLAAAKAGANQP